MAFRAEGFHVIEVLAKKNGRPGAKSQNGVSVSHFPNNSPSAAKQTNRQKQKKLPSCCLTGLSLLSHFQVEKGPFTAIK